MSWASSHSRVSPESLLPYELARSQPATRSLACSPIHSRDPLTLVNMSGTDPATSPSRSRVAGMVHAHQQAIDRASAQPTSPTSQRKNLAELDGGEAKQDGDAHKEEEDDNATKGRDGPTTDDVKAAAPKDDAKKTPSEAAQSPKSASDRVLETVPEGGKAGEGANGTGADGDNADERKDSTDGADDATKEDAKPAVIEEETQPLARILETLPSLGEKEQQIVQSNLERVAQYPPEMPLSTSWSAY